MKYPLLRAVVAGMIGGALLFMFPFMLAFIAFFGLTALMFKIYRGGHRHQYAYSCGPGHHYWKERMSKMTPEEREAFFQKMAGENKPEN